MRTPIHGDVPETAPGRTSQGAYAAAARLKSEEVCR